MERNEDFNIALTTMESRVVVANSTSILILNDDGRFLKCKPPCGTHSCVHACLHMYTHINQLECSIIT